MSNDSVEMKCEVEGRCRRHIEASTATRPHGHVSERGCGTPGVQLCDTADAPTTIPLQVFATAHDAYKQVQA